MVKVTSKKSLVIIGGSITAAIILILIVKLVVGRSNQQSSGKKAPPTPAPVPVNIIPASDRPYVTLQPLSSRNDLELFIGTLKIPATAVEVTLEYDRNEGVLDAVLKQFNFTQNTLTEKIFLGSKSAGGHTTYHDDVIGGTLTLKFIGDEPYALEVPWRYDDSQKEYQELSTADGFFQVTLDKPIRQSKIVVMQSPGAPAGLEGEIVAGPYVIRTVGSLPDTQASLTIRLKDSSDGSETLQLYDGEAWDTVDADIEGKTVKATVPLTDLYVVTR